MTLPKPFLAFDAEAEAGDQQRAEPRRNMFVAAVLRHGDISIPVRIRNLSRSGALIECPELLTEQSDVRLCRGSHLARGRIAWQRDNRAGIRFDGPVRVAEWLPNGDRDQGQSKVDAIIEACRAAGAATLGQTAPTPAITKIEIIRQLLALRESINRAAESLATDTAVAGGHAQSLQTLDLAAHDLDKLANCLAGH